MDLKMEMSSESVFTLYLRPPIGWARYVGHGMCHKCLQKFCRKPETKRAVKR